MCAKPPQGEGRTGKGTTVGMRGRVGRAKAIAIGTASVRAGSSAARMLGPPTGSRRTTMCVKPPQGEGKNGHVDYCRDEGPCRTGEGDCDRHSECQSGLSAAGMSGPPTGSRRTTMCASSAAGAAKKGQPWARPQGVSENGRLLGQAREGAEKGTKTADVYYVPVSGICVGNTR